MVGSAPRSVVRERGGGGICVVYSCEFKYLCIVFYLKISKRIFGEKTLSALSSCFNCSLYLIL